MPVAEEANTRCPECLSEDVIVQGYDFGVCRQTGYHDAGERFRCRACGATGDVDDLIAGSLDLVHRAKETDRR